MTREMYNIIICLSIDYLLTINYSQLRKLRGKHTWINRKLLLHVRDNPNWIDPQTEEAMELIRTAAALLKDKVNSEDIDDHGEVEPYIRERAIKFLEELEKPGPFSREIAYWYRGETEYNGLDHEGVVLQAQKHAKGLACDRDEVMGEPEEYVDEDLEP